MSRMYLFQLGSMGDLINILPICREYDYTLVTSWKYRNLLSGCPWLKVVYLEVNPLDLREALNLVKGPRIVTQLSGTGLLAPLRRCDSWQKEQWRLAGCLEQWDKIDRRGLFVRNKQREKALINHHGKGKILCSILSQNTQLPYTQLVYDLFPTAIHIGHLALVYPYDLLGLIEVSRLLITADTFQLHLATQLDTPTIEFINDKPTLWSGSVATKNAVFSCRYSEIKYYKTRLATEFHRHSSLDKTIPVKQEPPVTILLPVKNPNKKWLAECLASIKQQTYKNWTLLIVDDSDKPMRGSIRGPGTTLGAALNFGVSKCKTELIARMDADDIMHKDRLAKQVQYFLQHPETSVLGTQHTEFIDKTTYKTTSHPLAIDLDTLTYNKWGVNHSSVMFRRSVVLKHKYPDSSLAEDLVLWCRISKAGGIISNLPQSLMRYRKRLTNTIDQSGVATLVAPFVRTKNKLRVSFITNNLWYGGAEQWLLILLAATKNDIDWLVCTEGYISEALLEKLRLLGIEHTYGLTRALQFADTLLCWIPETRMPELRKLAVGKKIVLISHTDVSSTDCHFLYSNIVDVDYADLCVGCCVGATALMRKFGKQQKNYRTILNAFPQEQFVPIVPREAWRDAHKIKQSAFCVGYLGRISNSKGAFHLSMEAPKYKNTTFIFSGSAEFGVDHYDVKRRLELSPNCKFIGWQTDIGSFFGAMDAFIMTSKSEAFSNVTVEAWLAGVPIISTRTGMAAEYPELTTTIDFELQRLGDCISRLKNHLCLPSDKVQSIAQKVFSMDKFTQQWKEALCT